MSDPEDIIDDGDLFGDDDDVPGSISGSPQRRREDSDRDLDSGDDEDHEHKRRKQTPEETEQTVVEVNVVPHTVPAPSDGELNTLRIPDFVRFEAAPFDAATFTPPDAEGKTGTAHAIAASTIRYKKDEKGRLESNATLNRWSDGSMTLNIGDVVYELLSKPLAPKLFKTYSDVLDSHTYLAAPHIDAQIMQIIGHVNNELTVIPNAQQQQAAVEKLKANMMKAGRHNNHKGVNNSITRFEDPETQKKKLEEQERERNKIAKRKEQQQARLEQRAGGSRVGMGSDRIGAGKIKRAAPKRSARADYDSDDDLQPRGGRQDEYDMEDDFVAGSDEEEEEAGGDDSDEEEYDRPSSKSKKRAASDDDVERESGDDRGARPEAGGRRKRQVIEDDEDED